MKVRAVSKYNRISARKARLVADMLRNQKALAAFDILKYSPQKAARLFEKTLRSAVANAENNRSMDRKEIVISEILVDEGPTLKRHRPRARGMASSIRKRTSHITIVVEGQEKKKKPESKEIKSKDLNKDKKLTKKTASGAAHLESSNGT